MVACRRRTWLGESGYEGMNITTVLDSLIHGARIEPVIVVMPDAANRFGGSWYADSPATGLWERFFAEDLVSFVDRFSLIVFEGGHVNGVRHQFETSVFGFFDGFFRQ